MSFPIENTLSIAAALEERAVFVFVNEAKRRTHTQLSPLL